MADQDAPDKTLLDHPTTDQVQAFFLTLPDKRHDFTNPVSFYNHYKYYFNCYGYAAGSLGNPFYQQDDGRLFLTMAAPGALAGNNMRIFTAEELHRAVLADGFQAIEPSEYDNAQDTSAIQKNGYKLVAAFVDSIHTDGSSASFHFALRDDDGN